MRRFPIFCRVVAVVLVPTLTLPTNAEIRQAPFTLHPPTTVYTTQALETPPLWVARVPGKVFAFVTRPLRRLVQQPAVLRDTMRYAITIAFGATVFQWTHHLYAAAIPMGLDLLTFGIIRFFSVPNRDVASPFSQRLAGLSASLIPIGLGLTLLLHNPSIVALDLAAALNGMLMAYASHKREPPGPSALMPKLAGARHFGPVMTFGGILIGSAVTHSAVTPEWMGLLFLTGGLLYAAGSLSATEPLQAIPERQTATPESPAALLTRTPKLKYPFVLQMVLASFNAVPLIITSLVDIVLGGSPFYRALMQFYLGLSLWAGTRWNVRLQERWHLANRPVLSWWFSFFPIGGALILIAIHPTLWIWIPAFIALGMAIKMGTEVSKVEAETYPEAELRNTRALHSVALHFGMAMSPLLFAWLASVNGPQTALIFSGATLIVFQILMAGSKALRKSILNNADLSLPLIVGIIAAIRSHSWMAGANWFTGLFTGMGILYRIVPEIMTHIVRRDEHSNDIFKETSRPNPGEPLSFARPGHFLSRKAEPWEPDRFGPDGTPQRDYVTLLASDIHSPNPKMQVETALNAMRHIHLVPHYQPDGSRTPAFVIIGDGREPQIKRMMTIDERKAMAARQRPLLDYFYNGGTWWIPGDHDALYRKRAAHRPWLGAIRLLLEASWILPDGRRILAVHGDDGPLNSDDGFFTNLFYTGEDQDDRITKERRKLGIRSVFLIVPFIKEHLGLFTSASIVKKARLANERRVDVLAFGHTHIAGMWWTPPSLLYLHFSKFYVFLLRLFGKPVDESLQLIVNTGTFLWPDPLTFVGVRPDGSLELIVWNRMLKRGAGAEALTKAA